MSDASFDIIFSGKLQAGHSLADVKPRLIQLFKSDASKIDALFSGASIPLKRNLDAASAKKYQTILAKAGIVVDVVNHALKATTTTAIQQPEKVKTDKTDPESIRAARLAEQAKRRAGRKKAKTSEGATAKPLSMAERLAQTQAQPTTKVEEPAVSRETAVIDNDDSGLTLAAIGTDVLNESERSRVDPVDVDTSALNLREGGGELLDASERSAEVELDLDLHEYDLAQAGESLLQENERAVAAPVEVDTSKLLLEEPGGELLHADEKPVVETVTVDVGGLDLAPTGSDLGQLKSDKPAVSPDISNISLAP